MPLLQQKVKNADKLAGIAPAAACRCAVAFFVLKPVVMMTGFSGSGLAAIVGTFIALGSFRLYSNESE